MVITLNHHALCKREMHAQQQQRERGRRENNQPESKPLSFEVESFAPCASSAFWISHLLLTHFPFHHEAHKRLSFSPPVRAPLVSAPSKHERKAIVMIEAYHVSSETDLTKIEPNICDDPNRDGLLYGVSVACFTTTLRDGKLPNTSPYPRSVEKGTTVYRYFMEFNPKDYFVFLMAKTTLNEAVQVHFLLLQHDCGQEVQIAEFLRKQKLYRRGTKKVTSDRGYTKLLCEKEVRVTTEGSKRAWKRYFPDGKPNDYRSDDRHLGGNAFVNVVFWHEVQVQYLDEVEKTGYKFPPSDVAHIGMSSWFKKLLKRNPEEEERYRQQKHEAEVRMLRIERNQLRLERSKFEMEKSIFEEKADFAEEMAKKKLALKKAKKVFKEEKNTLEKEKVKLLKMLVEKKLESESPNKKTETQAHNEKAMEHTKRLEKKKKAQGHEAKDSFEIDKKYTRKQEKEKKTSLENQEIGGRADENAIKKKKKP